MRIKVMLISKTENILNVLKSMMTDEEITITGDSPGGSAALAIIENTSPDVVVMTLGSEDVDVLNLAERLILNRPKTFVILLADKLDAPTLQKAMAIGAHNVTEFPDNPKVFAEYIKSVYRAESTKIEALQAKKSIAWMSKVITVYGSKGGLGKTTIATNLAVKLAEKNKKVALIDLDLQFGDVHVFMDLEPKETIAELVQDVYTPSIDSIRSYMMVHPSGVHVLCAPKSPEYAELVSPEKLQNLLSLIRSYYDYVIIDTPPAFTEISITAIEASTLVLFVTGLDISILKNSKLSMSLLDSLQQKEKVRLIVNRAVEMNSVTINDVQTILGCPIWARIPSDYKVAVSSLNRGEPIVTGSPNSRIGMAISDMANLIESGEPDADTEALKDKAKRKKGLFGRKDDAE